MQVADEEAIARAVTVADALLREITPPDQRLTAVVRDQHAAAFTMALTDEVLRSPDTRSAAATFRRVVGRSTPRAFPLSDRLLLKAGAAASRVAPALVMKLVRDRLRSVTARQVLPSVDPALARRLAATHAGGSATNVNVLGEAILGEAEAELRRDRIVEMLGRADVDAVSVKLSAIASNLSAMAFDQTVERVVDRLRPLYRAARDRAAPALVTLDMEEFRDLELTAAAFRRILSEPEFRSVRAGIVLQAYLPDAHAMAEQLASFALERRRSGGAPIRIRLVKGANLAMERVEAELRGWNPAPYGSKADVDASYKRLLDRLLRRDLDDAVVVGLASHNLFDIAWGMGLRDALQQRGSAARLEFETLEGMADGLAAAIARRGAVSLVYSPVVDRRSFEAAIAYLVRRLDENTSPDNFLNALVDLRPGSARFDAEAAKFADAVRRRHDVDVQSHRHAPRLPLAEGAGFHNEPDTDLAVEAQRAALLQPLKAWRGPTSPIVPVVGGVDVPTGRTVDLSDPSTGTVIAHAELADADLVDRCVRVAVEATATWNAVPASRRRAVLRRIAEAVCKRRADIVAAMAYETGKTAAQGDPEVSEAVDFARYYAESMLLIEQLTADGLVSTPRGAVVVAPPWNFPFAILMGGVCGALAAGNAVVIKPAPQAILCAQMVAACCWEAGVPREVVQFLPCPDDEVGQRLISHPDVGAVVLTGSIDTARLFHSWRADLCLLAETSGKNTMVVTASADIDLALKDLVASAFGHAGQKCSAASLVVLAPCWYDDPAVLARLGDAVRSLRCGPAHDPGVDVGPLIDVPSPHLRRALTMLEPGEEWLVKPQQLDEAGRCWSPGVRVGVRPGSWFHRTECFGPVLGVLRAGDLDEALSIQNGVEFGLTAGLHSLDVEEISAWTQQVEAGNLYVNRAITGAIVSRQPFGGWKHSAVGPGAKAGGPSYVLALRRWNVPEEAMVDVDLAKVRAGFAHWHRTFFAAEIDVAGLVAERNVLRHRRLPGGVALRVGPGAPSWAISVAEAASAVTGTSVVVSIAADESDAAFADRLPSMGVDRVRVLGSVDRNVRIAAHRADITVDDGAITTHGRVELSHWLREQSVTTTAHRHGHIRRR